MNHFFPTQWMAITARRIESGATDPDTVGAGTEVAPKRNFPYIAMWRQLAQGLLGTSNGAKQVEAVSGSENEGTREVLPANVPIELTMGGVLIPRTALTLCCDKKESSFKVTITEIPELSGIGSTPLIARNMLFNRIRAKYLDVDSQHELSDSILVADALVPQAKPLRIAI